jgi:hypothetical protein
MFVENLGEIGMAAGLLLVLLAAILPRGKTEQTKTARTTYRNCPTGQGGGLIFSPFFGD